MCFLDFHLPRVMNLNRILAILALLSPGVFSLAQTPNTASIRGQVLDQSRAAAQDTEVTISQLRWLQRDLRQWAGARTRFWPASDRHYKSVAGKVNAVLDENSLLK